MRTPFPSTSPACARSWADMASRIFIVTKKGMGYLCPSEENAEEWVSGEYAKSLLAVALGLMVLFAVLFSAGFRRFIAAPGTGVLYWVVLSPIFLASWQ